MENQDLLKDSVGNALLDVNVDLGCLPQELIAYISTYLNDKDFTSFFSSCKVFLSIKTELWFITKTNTRDMLFIDPYHIPDRAIVFRRNKIRIKASDLDDNKDIYSYMIVNGKEKPFILRKTIPPWLSINMLRWYDEIIIDISFSSLFGKSKRLYELLEYCRHSKKPKLTLAFYGPMINTLGPELEDYATFCRVWIKVWTDGDVKDYGNFFKVQAEVHSQEELKFLGNTRIINAYKANIHDISCLRNVEILDISYTNVTEIPTLPHLRQLFIEGTKVIDIRNLTNLFCLDISRMKYKRVFIGVSFLVNVNVIITENSPFKKLKKVLFDQSRYECKHSQDETKILWKIIKKI